MAALFAAIVGFLGSVFAKILADRLLAFVALKALLVFLFIVVVPIVLNNVIHDMLSLSMDLMSAEAAGATGMDGGMDFTGFLGWLCVCFKIPECMAVLISAIQLNLTLKLIPFSPVR